MIWRSESSVIRVSLECRKSFAGSVRCSAWLCSVLPVVLSRVVLLFVR